MLFNKHSNLAGTHAFLGASNYHWVNYEPEKLDRAYMLHQAARRGTRLHELAKEAIALGVKLAEEPVTTMSMYVNDAIGYGMIPEQVLYYSDNCYGTVDTIGFRKNPKTGNPKLRIHDLKTGVVKASEKQLYVYAALFCLEYQIDPHSIEHELRIYQNNEVYIYEGDPDFILFIMKRIEEFDKRIEKLKEAEL